MAIGTRSRDAVGDVAIVGMSCQLPGGVKDARTLWDFCEKAQDSTGPIPKSRFEAENFYYPTGNKPGLFNVRGGSFLDDDIGLFDPAFFNINEAEAKAIDPQHRILLESAFLALENAGIDISSIANRDDVGVFAASSHSEYESLQRLDPYVGSVYSITGIASTMFANRLSYFFNIRGPSITVDTACSSGLTALHHAVESIRNGECSCAIVGGSFLQLSPLGISVMNNLGTLSKDGKSFSFDHRANGYGRGEGAACIVLKAVTNVNSRQDHVRALIRNTGINHAGRSQGIAFPNGQAQAELVARVYKSVGLDPRDTVYVEGHGTGTQRGDPIEAESISVAFDGLGRGPDKPIYLGSVKSNFGHLEAVSGLVSVIKCVLMLERKMILPNANFEKANPMIDMEGLNLKVPTECIPWPDRGIRRASINNFGFGGSNAHAILEQGPDADLNRFECMTCRQSTHKGDEESRLFVVSAKDEKTLKLSLQSLARYAGAFPQKGQKTLADLSYTLCCRRTQFPWSFAVQASTQAQLLEKLEGRVQVRKASILQRPCFVFTGQGAQWPQMGVSLMRYPTYANKMREADGILNELGADWSLLDELSKPPKSSLIAVASISQPATTALQLALVCLFQSWDITPVAVCGHSSGEIAAAYAAGLLDFRTALAVAYHRGKVCTELKEMDSFIPGSMMAVGAASGALDALMGSLRSGLATIACYNSPSSVTVSGDRSAVLELQAKLEKRGIFNRLLSVDVAYHSEQMTLVAEMYIRELTPVLAANSSKESSVSFFSSVSGQTVAPRVVRSPWYWATNLVCPVQFAQAIPSMLSAQVESHPKHSLSLIEIGPHSALRGPLKQMMAKQKEATPNLSLEYVSTLQRDGDACQSVLELAAWLINKGFPLKAPLICRESPQFLSAKLLDDIPPYPFNKAKRHWQDSRVGGNFTHSGTPWNDLLGHMITGSVAHLEFRNVFSLDDIPWLRDHQISGKTVFPMTGYISMAVEALCLATKESSQAEVVTGYLIREMAIARAFILSEVGDNELFTSLTSQFSGTRGEIPNPWFDFRIQSWTKERGFLDHCKGSVGLVTKHATDSIFEENVNSKKLEWAERLRSRIDEKGLPEFAPALLYKRMAAIGLSYGPTFRGLTSFRPGEDCAVATVTKLSTQSLMPMQIETPLKVHPPLFDSFLHTVTVNTRNSDGPAADVPAFVREVFISNDLSQGLNDKFHVYNHDAETEKTSRFTKKNFAIFCGDEKIPAVEFRDIRCFDLSEDNAAQSQADLLNPLRFDWADHPEFVGSNALDDAEYSGTAEVEQVKEIEDLEQQAYYVMKRMSSIDASTVGPDRHLSLLVKWMQSSVKQVESTGASLTQKNWVLLSESEQTRFIERVGSSCSYGEWIQHVGESLCSIIQGQVDPLSMLMANNRLWRIYETSCVFERCGDQLAQLVSLAARQNAVVRILEIGAGTGSLTCKVLEALSSKPSLGLRCESYDYTDISTELFEAAATKFELWKKKLNFKKLDISRDPVEQGFAEGFYDIVIAGDVIHATPDVGQSLSHICRLLKPDGVLAMAELSRFSNLFFPFATLPGWWERDSGAVISKNEWHELLLQAGFTGVEASWEDFPACDLHRVYWTRVQSPSEFSKTVTLISDNPGMSPSDLETEIGDALERELGLKLERSTLAAEKTKDGVLVVIDDSGSPILTNLDSERFQSLQKLMNEASTALWVSRAPHKGASQEADHGFVTGFARTLRLENAGLKFVHLHLDAACRKYSATSVAKVFKHSFIKSPNSAGADLEFREQNGRIQVPRLVPDDVVHDVIDREANTNRVEEQDLWQEGRSLELTMGSVGLFNTLNFQGSKTSAGSLGDEEVLVEIKAVGLNFKDVLIALGSLPWMGLGLECSGVVIDAGKDAQSRFRAGDSVVYSGNSLFSTHVRCKMSRLIRFPNSLSFVEAASVPVVFATAYESLVNSARLQRSETVLIHAAAGGVGQAAIMIAQWIGAEIFCTVGSSAKKEHIMHSYNIPEDHIFSSRSPTFEQPLMAMTQNQGVDVVLNSLSGDLLRCSWRCLATLGRFIEIGKRDAVANNSLEMAPFERGVTYTAIDLSLCIGRKETQYFQLMEHIMELMSIGTIRPVQPITSLPITDLETGLRIMQAGKHMGKIVFTLDRDARVKVRSQPSGVNFLDPDKSYLISGGVGGLGRSLTDFFIRNGAKNIILGSRSASPDALQSTLKTLIDIWASQGLKVLPVKCDFSSLQDVQNLLATAAEQGMPPVRGVIHGAMVLRDALYETSEFEDWRTVLKPKIDGAINLHHALAGTPQDFFICLSSAAGALGNAGQASYAGSNTFLDAFCHWRSQQGLSATSINLPAIRDAGYVAESVAQGARAFDSSIYGFSITNEQFLLLTKSLIRQSRITTTTPKAGTQVLVGATKQPGLGRDRRLESAVLALVRSSLTDHNPTDPTTTTSAPEDISIDKVALQRCTNLSDASVLTVDALGRKLAKNMMIPADEIGEATLLREIGLDSLVAVEFRNWIAVEFQAAVPLMDIVASASVGDLAGKVIKRSKLLEGLRGETGAEGESEGQGEAEPEPSEKLDGDGRNGEK